MKNVFNVLIAAVILFFSSCIKEGPGGKASIKGTVMHHSKLIPWSVVYIKYGATDSPGSNVTYYDASVNADVNAYFEFTDLKRGDYYLFGVGYDSSSVQDLSGGVPIKIKSKTEVIETVVPVTEP